jgi:[protein-PII] uridylyltransferase
MRTSREKFEAILRRVQGVDPGTHLEDYRRVLRLMNHQVRLLANAGAGGREACRARALLVDVLITHLWEFARGSLSAQARAEFPPIAVVALGGYGRGELNPCSDLDLCFLHQGQVVVGSKPLPSLERIMQVIYMTLLDLGFKPGHSVRTVAESVEQANHRADPKSMETKTSLLEARLVVGDAALFERLQKAFVARCVEGHEADYIAARMKDQSERRARFGNSATMQEPNIKNGCGGLRDYQNLRWMVFFKYRTLELAGMEEREFLTRAERRQLEVAYDFLLAVRSEMHALSPAPNRPYEVLTKALQPTVASRLGYKDASPSRRLERFMRDLYTHMRNIFLITRTLEERLALLPSPGRLPRLRQLLPKPLRKDPPQAVDGFRFEDGQIHGLSSRVFKDSPRRLMRVFLHAQQRGLRLHPDLAALIRHDLRLVNRSFLADEHVRETFLEILSQRGNVAPTLRAMHEVGLLGKYVPEFGRLTCLVQHEFYHQYAADEHTLVCLAQVDRVAESREGALARYAELLHALERPSLLYLALLLHDSGKGDARGDHAARGVVNAQRVARRLRLDGSTTHALCLLIEHHTDMSVISQRRDLEDPAVIRQFAALVQNLENLQMLTVLTFADAQATSDKLWNGFKDALLWDLHHKAREVLAGGTDFIRAEERQRELLAEEVCSLLPRSFGSDEVQAHFGALPARYFRIHNAREVFADLALAHRFMHQQIAADDRALEPVVTWHNEPDRGYTSAKVCTWDRAGLFSILCGSFSASGVNILSAQIFSRSDGIVLDTFYVTEAQTGGLVGREARERFEDLLGKALTGREMDLTALIARRKVARPLYHALPGERIRTRIHFDNDTSADFTVIDLETEDHLGLLHTVSGALASLGLDIALAKITTEKGAAVDTFYVRDGDGRKLDSAARQQQVAEEIYAAIRALEKAGLPANA